MSRHHNTQHPERGRSRYPQRLEARGLRKSPVMTPVDVLRTRQARRVEETGVPWSQHAPMSEEEAA